MGINFLDEFFCKGEQRKGLTAGKWYVKLREVCFIKWKILSYVCLLMGRLYCMQ